MTRFILNGKDTEVTDGGARSLLHVLREELALNGAKYGCGEGQCGTCSVILNGKVARACVTNLGDVAGARVITIEGGGGRETQALQAAFLALGAFQCGYCTPGMIMTATALLQTERTPSEAQIAEALAGNVCRCGTYPRIVQAVQRAAAALAGAGSGIAPSTAGPRIEQSPALTAHVVPWDRREPTARDLFETLGDGIIAITPPSPPRGGPPRGGAWVHVGPSGQATAGTGKMEMGQGTRTGLSLLVAEELHLPLERVSLVMGDTDLSPFDMGTFGSRSTPDAGTDLRRAAASVRKALGTSNAAAHPESLSGMRQLLIAGDDAPVTPAERWSSAGRPQAQVDARAIVAGAKHYASDFSRPGMLHGRVLQAPAVGATLRTADCARAEQLAQVVRDAEMIGVVAASLLDANAALAAIHAEWTLAPQPSEAELAQHLRDHPTEAFGWEASVHDVVGDPARAFAAAAVRLEQTYVSAYLAHMPIEPRAALAEWQEGRVTIWISTQVPFMVREDVAEALGLAEDAVRVVALDMGDGFGGKHSVRLALDAARLARAARRPVKIQWTREEEMTCGHFRPMSVIDVKAAADASGLLAWEFRNFNGGSAALLTPYTVAQRSQHYQPAVSPYRQGPYRSLAAAANNFARESAIDELAHALGEDPLAFRLRTLPDPRLVAVLRAASARMAGAACGVAVGFEKGGRVATCAEVRIDAGEPVVTRIVTAFDCGAIVNPDGVRNQIEGATVMALGGALFERVRFDGGRILSRGYSSYRVPRFGDVPAIETILLDQPDQPSAGAGETPLIAVAPAIANAIFRASGRRLRALPLLA